MGVEVVEEGEEGTPVERPLPAQEVAVDARGVLAVVDGIVAQAEVELADRPPQPLARRVAHQSLDEGRLRQRRGGDHLLETHRHVVVLGEAATEPRLVNRVEGIGDERAGGVSARRERLGERTLAFIERRAPARAELGGVAAREHAAVRWERPRRGGERPVEHDAGRSQPVELRRGGSRVAVQAHRRRAHGVEDDEQHVRGTRGRRGERRHRPPLAHLACAPRRDARDQEECRQRDRRSAKHADRARGISRGKPRQLHADADRQHHRGDLMDRGREDEQRERCERGEEGDGKRERYRAWQCERRHGEDRRGHGEEHQVGERRHPDQVAAERHAAVLPCDLAEHSQPPLEDDDLHGGGHERERDRDENHVARAMHPSSWNRHVLSLRDALQGGRWRRHVR